MDRRGWLMGSVSACLGLVMGRMRAPSKQEVKADSRSQERILVVLCAAMPITAPPRGTKLLGIRCKRYLMWFWRVKRPDAVESTFTGKYHLYPELEIGTIDELVENYRQNLELAWAKVKAAPTYQEEQYQSWVAELEQHSTAQRTDDGAARIFPTIEG